jgi:murein DD-endopeptidase MepM/ murein hydrolase activator NlpD
LQGTVAAASDDSLDHADSKANRLVIHDGAGLAVHMGHLQQGSSRVRRGAVTAVGSLVAQVGSSGTRFPHLHMEAWRGVSPVAIVLQRVRVGLNPSIEDPWSVMLDRWIPEAGLFFEPVGPY